MTKLAIIIVSLFFFSNFSHANDSTVGHAQVYIELENYQQAAILLRKALKLNPSRQDLVQNIRLLDRMNNSQI